MKILVEEGGLLRLPAPLLKRMRLMIGTEFEAVAHGQNSLLFLRGTKENKYAGRSDKITLFGNIAQFGVADLFSTMNMAQKTGILVFELESGVKAIYFQAGEIVFATSSDPADMLGRMLFKTGKINAKQLAETEAAIKPGVRFGSLLIQKGFLGPQDLFQGVKYQIEEIVYSVFNLHEGVFYFIGDETVSDDILQVSLNTQSMLMEGYTRMDEWKVLRETIPDNNTVIIRLDADENSVGNPALKKLFSFVDGKRTVAELMRAAGLGEFQIYKYLGDLLRLKAVAVKQRQEQPQRTGPRPPEQLVKEYNRLFTSIIKAIHSHAPSIDLAKTFTAFVGNLPKAAQTVLDGVAMQPDGQLDGETLMKNAHKSASTTGKLGGIAGLEAMMTQQALQTGLQEAIKFFLFTAKNVLEPERADALIRAVREVEKKLSGK